MNTRPHSERMAVGHLARQRYEAYCPPLHKRLSHARHTQNLLRPMCPSYVFAQLAENLRWRPILPTRSVKSVVSNRDRPGLLEHSILSAMTGRKIDDALCVEGSAFKLGQRVEIVGSAFECLAGFGARERLTVLMELLNSSVNLRLTGDMVAAG